MLRQQVVVPRSHHQLALEDELLVLLRRAGARLLALDAALVAGLPRFLPATALGAVHLAQLFEEVSAADEVQFFGVDVHVFVGEDSARGVQIGFRFFLRFLHIFHRIFAALLRPRASRPRFLGREPLAVGSLAPLLLLPPCHFK